MEVSGTPTGPVEDPPLTTLHVARAVAGDLESLEWLVGHLSPLLREHAAYRLGSVLRRHCDPEDLVNDAWLAVLPRMSDLLGEIARRRTPVLLKYMSNTVLFRIQKLARRHARQLASGSRALATGVERDVVADRTTEASGVVTRALRAERRDLVRECLDELEPGDREVLLLRGIEQLSTSATATMLGIGAEAAAKRYQRALAKMRARLPESVFAELSDD